MRTNTYGGVAAVQTHRVTSTYQLKHVFYIQCLKTNGFQSCVLENKRLNHQSSSAEFLEGRCQQTKSKSRKKEDVGIKKVVCKELSKIYR